MRCTRWLKVGESGSEWRRGCEKLVKGGGGSGLQWMKLKLVGGESAGQEEREEAGGSSDERRHAAKRCFMHACSSGGRP
jgi:hypothetical protein